MTTAASTYTAQTLWERGTTSVADFLDGRYQRGHRLRFDGGADVAGSASVHNVKGPYADPAAVDPEETFVSALSSCHMLFVLWFAQRRGWCVDRYLDDASGVLADDERGRRSMTVVTLRPQVTFSGGAADGRRAGSPAPRRARGVLHRQLGPDRRSRRAPAWLVRRAGALTGCSAKGRRSSRDRRASRRPPRRRAAPSGRRDWARRS